YEARLESKPSPLPELTIQYADYAAWQRKFLSSGVMEEQLAYWRRQLDGAPPVLELPTDRPRDVKDSFWGSQLRQDLSAELRPERKAGHNPLVQVLFVMQNTPPMVQRFGGLELKPLGVSTSSRFDLVMFVNDPETSPSTTWMYNPNLFDGSTIERIAELYRV